MLYSNLPTTIILFIGYNLIMLSLHKIINSFMTDGRDIVVSNPFMQFYYVTYFSILFAPKNFDKLPYILLGSSLLLAIILVKVSAFLREKDANKNYTLVEYLYDDFDSVEILGCIFTGFLCRPLGKVVPYSLKKL